SSSTLHRGHQGDYVIRSHNIVLRYPLGPRSDEQTLVPSFQTGNLLEKRFQQVGYRASLRNFDRIRSLEIAKQRKILDSNEHSKSPKRRSAANCDIAPDNPARSQPQIRLRYRIPRNRLRLAGFAPLIS